MKSAHHQQLIQYFYTSFAALDAEGMADCYHKDILFNDPGFGDLKGERAVNMWRMLCASQQGKDFRVEFSDLQADEHTGRAHWEAYYTFSKTGRKVHNIIDAQFKFQDGKIIEHIDTFDLYRWAKQAFGLTGTLIGWTPFFKNKLHQQTNQLLNRFEKKRM